MSWSLLRMFWKIALVFSQSSVLDYLECGGKFQFSLIIMRGRRQKMLEVENGARNVISLDGFVSLGKSSVTKKEF